MKSHRQELWFNLPARRAFVNITGPVQEAVEERREGGVVSGERDAYIGERVHQRRRAGVARGF